MAGTTPVVDSASTKKHEEWEYEVLADLGSDVKGKLNALGKDGWILVATEPSFIFRRPKLEDKKGSARLGFSV